MEPVPAKFFAGTGTTSFSGGLFWDGSIFFSGRNFFRL
jgi:hypothetical protein